MLVEDKKDCRTGLGPIWNSYTHSTLAAVVINIGVLGVIAESLLKAIE
jgi:hypothetical protein